MKNNTLIEFLRKWTDWLEETALVMFVITDVLIICFIIGSVSIEHFNRHQNERGLEYAVHTQDHDRAAHITLHI